jgi:fatty-acyl-CoA synthase
MTIDPGDSGKRARKAWVRALELTARVAREPLVTLPVVIERLAGERGAAPALLGDDATVSFADLAASSRRYARWALAQNIGHGDVVALIMPNCPDYLAIWLGITRVGGVVALVNCNLAPMALAHSVRIVEAKHLIVAAELEGSLAEALPALPPDLRCWVHGAGAYGFSRIDRAVEALDGCPLGEGEFRPPSLADRALFIYTSGTTGLPKAANVSHARVMQWSHWFAGLIDIGPDDRMYNCLPMYHSIGGVVAVCSPLVAGASVVIRPRFSVSRFWDEVCAWDCTLFQYIGELCRYLVQSAPHPKEAAHRLRLCCGNGLRADVWEGFQTRFRIPEILEYYAATEANFSLYNCEGRVGSIGRIPPFLAGRFAVAVIEVDIETGVPVRGADGFGRVCPAGETGEAVARIQDAGSRAGTRFEGYADGEASERKILRDLFVPGDAWYRSGDLMRKDAQGFFYFVDRLGDTFRWKGENVSTAEVTAAISAGAGIVSAAVYGVPVPGTEGRAGMAALIVDETFDLAAFRRELSGRLPDYARPVFLRILRELDMTATFRPRLQDLRREGYDPAATGDALYLDDRAAGAFVRLDAALHQEIQARARRF